SLRRASLQNRSIGAGDNIGNNSESVMALNTLNETYDPLSGYTLDARIMQKKDQMEELCSTGVVIQTPNAEEVRTGQQFLIKLQLSRPGAVLSSAKFPTVRIERREAISTAGEPRADPEPLTLQIIVHLVKSGQVRKGACAKCCHKYGPTSPILVLLDPLSPSITDPSTYAHLDTSTGSVTILAKVLCSSTDHGERGNKDRYKFEFRLRRTNSMYGQMIRGDSPLGFNQKSEDGDVVASCITMPIMCSGHHKAKKVYPSQRSSKVTNGDGGPVPKTKTIKRHKSVSHAVTPLQNSNLMAVDQSEKYLRSGSISSNSNYPSPLPCIQDTASNISIMSNFGDDQSSEVDIGSSSSNGQSRLSAASLGSGQGHQPSENQAPRVFEVRPDHGPIRKTTDVVLRGLFFRDGMVPYFGCFPAQDIIVETSTLIVCKAPESPLPGTVPITIYDSNGTSFAELGQFTYTDDSETELLILQLQLRMAHRALEYLHTQATGQRGSATDILRGIPGLAPSPPYLGGSSLGSGNSMAVSNGLDYEDSDQPFQTLEQVENGIINTLRLLPAEVDISLQIRNQGNLLHLSILLGLDRLALYLIEAGCDIEALDAWAMTPLMYAVIQGNEPIIRELVIAGASSSGARTPLEFYLCLPRPAVPTVATIGCLSISCTRYSPVSRANISDATHNTFGLVQTVYSEASDSENDGERSGSESVIHPPAPSSTLTIADSQVPVESAPTMASRALPTTLASSPSSQPPRPSLSPRSDGGRVDENDPVMMARLAEALQGVHVNQDMAPLAQQDLPPIQTVDSDGNIIINNKVLKGDEIRRGVVAEGGAATAPPTLESKESGYHSGISKEVQDRLRLMSHAQIPFEGLTMSAIFQRSASMIPKAQSTTVYPDNLFRTGDSFTIEIRLATTTLEGEGGSESALPLPRQFVGIRFPHEMVKRVSGEPFSTFDNMTYNLRMYIELGRPQEGCSSSASSPSSGTRLLDGRESSVCGDGIDLKSACKSCSAFLHERRTLSPTRISQEDPSIYPILQFHVPTAPIFSVGQQQQSALSQGGGPFTQRPGGVVELKDGQLKVKARVNCSSLHSLIQREKARRTAELQEIKEQQERGAAASSSSSSTTSSSSSGPAASKAKMSLNMADLQDPGFVFTFELVHPDLNTVVAHCETEPIPFQSYSRGRS
ncbi:SPT3 Dosage dependent suppressor of Ty-induced promoter mutations-like protein, partial [Lunasporangiospora selenospora]